MNSLHRNQPEDTREDLAGAKAVERVRAIVKTAETCFFQTAVAVEGSMGARPMNVREVDDSGALWFLSASDSHINQEIARDPAVTLTFQGSPHSDFLVLKGQAELSTDKDRIKELWEPILKTWFTEGVDDPRITIIRVDPDEGYYWDTKHGNMVAGIKMLIGAATGKTLDDSIEGKLDL
jgi:general stress protein 26